VVMRDQTATDLILARARLVTAGGERCGRGGNSPPSETAGQGQKILPPTASSRCRFC